MSYSAAVITVSDKGSLGQRVDTSGPNLCALLEERGFLVCYTALVPDDSEQIKQELVKCSDDLGVALILTTGAQVFLPEILRRRPPMP